MKYTDTQLDLRTLFELKTELVYPEMCKVFTMGGKIVGYTYLVIIDQ